MIYLIRSKVLAYIVPLRKKYQIIAIDDDFQLYIVPEGGSPSIDLTTDYSRESCEILHLDGTTSSAVLRSVDIYGEANSDLIEIARKVAVGQTSQANFKSMLVNKLNGNGKVQFKVEGTLDLKADRDILFRIYQNNPGKTRKEILQERDDQLLKKETEREAKRKEDEAKYQRLKPIGEIEFWDQTVSDQQKFQWQIYVPTQYVNYAYERLQDGIKESDFDDFLKKLRSRAISYGEQPKGTRVDGSLRIRKMGVSSRDVKILGFIPWSTDYVDVVFE